MRTISFVLAPIVLALSSAATADCAGDVPKNLDGCSTNHGYNEGADCGLKALIGSGVTLPADLGQQALGMLGIAQT